MKGDIDNLTKYLPALGTVTQDNANGRYLCYVPGYQRKSISWTRVGVDGAEKKALEYMWGLYKTITGKDIPKPFVFLKVDDAWCGLVLGWLVVAFASLSNNVIRGIDTSEHVCWGCIVVCASKGSQQ